VMGIKIDYKRVVLLSVCLGLLSACSTISDIGLSDSEIVAKRSQARLDALINGDVEKALSYTTPSFRQFTTPRIYRTRVAGTGRWKEAKVESVVCEAESCDVKTTIKYLSPLHKMTNVTSLREKWIRVDGAWWLYQPVR